MRLLRYSLVSGALAALLGTAAVGAAVAAPTEQVPPGWTVVTQPQWNPGTTWYSYQTVVQPTTAVIQSAPVAVPAQVR